MLFDGGRRGLALQRFDIRSDRDRFNVFKVLIPSALDPGQKLLDRPVIGRSCVSVPDRNRPLRQTEGLRQGRADRMPVRILMKDYCTYLPFESKLAALPLAAASDALGRFETSQTRTVQSWLAEAISLLSALNATRMIAPS